MKPIIKMSRAEAEQALARELAWKAKGLSYSTRRLGALRARIAQLNPTTLAELFTELGR